MIDIQPKETSWNSPFYSSPSPVEITDDRSIPVELLQSLRQHSLFQRTNNESFIEKLACIMHLRTYSHRDIIVVEGEQAKAMFFLLRGSVDVCSADFERIYATLPKGSCFGEIGILYSMPRTATVIASSKCIVAVLTAEEVNTILPQYPEVEKILRFEAEERLTLLKKSKSLNNSEKVTRKPLTERNVEDIAGARNLLQKLPYFQQCPEEFLHSISLKVEPRHYSPNDYILKKGDEGKELFFIISGTMELTNIDSATITHIKRLSAGDYFGDIAVILNTPSAADARAVTALEMYILKKSDFMSVLNFFPELQKHFEAMAENSLNDLRLKASLICKADTDITENPFVPLAEGPSGTPDTSPSSVITPDSVCSTTSDQDPTLPTTAADALRSVETKRRRASIAIWSDPNLVALANKHLKESKEESKLKVETGSTDVVMTPVQFSVDGRLSLLNEDILGRIINELDFMSIIQFAFVSKQCRELIKQSEKVMQTLDLSGINKRITDSAISHIIPFAGARVKHLNLAQCFYITDDGFKSLIEALPNIESMDLNSCWLLTDKSLSCLAESCPQVTKLDLSNCRKISDVGIFKLLDAKASNGYPELTELSLSYCKKLSDMTMGHLAEFCADTLESLNIQRCTRITDQGFAKWSDANFSQLKYLNLTDCSFLTDTAISNLVAAAPSLKHLLLSFCCALSDNAIEGLIRLSDLEELDASFCGAAVSDVSIQSLLKSVATGSIKSLNLRGCVRITDSCVKTILELARLTFLNISQCPGISVDAKEYIKDSGNVENLVA